jgi:hypothetical protein
MYRNFRLKNVQKNLLKLLYGVNKEEKHQKLIKSSQK